MFGDIYQHFAQDAVVIAAGTFFLAAAYVTFLYILNGTNLLHRLHIKGLYRCPHYRHTDILFGSDFQRKYGEAEVRGDRQAFARESFERYGKTFEVNHWGERIFWTCDPVNAQSVMSSQFGKFGVAPSRIHSLPWLGPGVFTSDGNTWKSSRDSIKPIFQKAEISDMTCLDKHLSRLLEKLPGEDVEVDLQPLFLRMYLAYSIDLLFGEDVDSRSGTKTEEDLRAFIAACDRSLIQIARTKWPWFIRWYKGWTKDWNKAYATCHDFVNHYVDAALDCSNVHDNRSPAFIDDLIEQTSSDDRAYIRDQMLNIFFPARDTMGIGISMVLFQLARHPLPYAKIRAEVHAAGLTKPEDLDYEAIKNLPYTRAVVNETLRLHTPAGRLRRDVLEDTWLPRGGGTDGSQPVFVPKGAGIDVHMHVMQRDVVSWGNDAHVFRPERWLESSMSHQRRTWEYLPFAGGPRICPAQALVMAQLVYIVARFALKFRELVNRDPEKELVEQYIVLLRIRNGVLVKLVE